jgi:histidyl-tRNA synthetase
LSIRHDAEIPAVIHAVFSELGIGAFTIHLNNRKLLRGFFESLGLGDGEQQTLVLREVDKLDKRGVDAVRATLLGEGFALPAAAVDGLLAFVQVRTTSWAEATTRLDALRGRNAMLDTGVDEMAAVLEMLRAQGVPESDIALNFSIARGLDYYTGTVYETLLDDHAGIGSICSGGRYDDLAGHYTKSKLPGVGISIGLTRLFYQLQEAGLVKSADSSVEALVGLMGDAQLPETLAIATELRQAGVNVEAQLEPRKLQKQFQYADKAGIRYVLLAGDDEAARGVVTVKDLRRQEQFELPRAQLAAAFAARRAAQES